MKKEQYQNSKKVFKLITAINDFTSQIDKLNFYTLYDRASNHEYYSEELKTSLLYQYVKRNNAGIFQQMLDREDKEFIYIIQSEGIEFFKIFLTSELSYHTKYWIMLQEKRS
jgi:hypothetical protein